MKLRHYLMAAGVAIAAWLALFGDKTPNSKADESVRRTPIAKAGVTLPSATPPNAATAIVSGDSNADTNTHHEKVKPEPVILALRARDELIGGASAADESSTFFGGQSWVPPAPPPPKATQPPPPTAPALPFTYIGKKMEDAIWEVYLTRGEHTFIVRESSVIEETYRIDSIKPPILTLTYLPLKQMQTLPIGGAE